MNDKFDESVDTASESIETADSGGDSQSDAAQNETQDIPEDVHTNIVEENGEASEEIPEDRYTAPDPDLIRELGWGDSDSEYINGVKFIDENGQVKWEEVAPNGGFVEGSDKMVTLEEGRRLVRAGSSFGTYTANEGTSLAERALAQREGKDSEYEVLKPIDEVREGIARPAAGQPGGGVQQKLPRSVISLEATGHLAGPTPLQSYASGAATASSPDAEEYEE